MLYKKSGFPGVHEIVLCTVSRIQHTSVFVELDEYDMQGMLHISEVSPGRIRNLADYVKVGKKIVCKILRVNKERGHIDLSLRRVSEGPRRDKLNQIKAENKAEKIVEMTAQALKKDVKKVYDQVTEKVFEKYEYLHEFFNDVALKGVDIKTVKIPDTISKKLEEVIKQKITVLEMETKGKLTISSYAPDGVEIVKEALKKIEAKDIQATYLGSGTYQVKLKSEDPRKAEEKLKKTVQESIDFLEEKDAEASFTIEE
jgi:translation initiation factor 2 subunit 1